MSDHVYLCYVRFWLSCLGPLVLFWLSCLGPLVLFWLSCLGPLVLFWLSCLCPILLLRKFQIIWRSNLPILNVPDEGYSRDASCALNLISTFHGMDLTSVSTISDCILEQS
jgi:hypothetical protein